MPAGFTHMTLARKSLGSLESDIGYKADVLLSAQLGTYLMGSLGPDLPYMGFLDDLIPLPSQFNHIADELHKKETTSIPFAALAEAKDLHSQGNIEVAQSIFAFFTGYLSHVVADGFTHPFVRDRVGNYGPETKDPHRILEMKIDVLALDYYLKQEVNGVSPQTVLAMFENCKHRTEIFECYSKNLEKFHAQSLSSEKLEQLSLGMIRMLNSAEGDFPSWYRDILGNRGFAYFTYEEVKNNEEEIRTLKEACDAKNNGIIYNSLSLDPVDIFDDVFPRFLKHMPKVIEAAYSYVFENGPEFSSLVPAINLDTGRLLIAEDLKNKPAFWELV